MFKDVLKTLAVVVFLSSVAFAQTQEEWSEEELWELYDDIIKTSPSDKSALTPQERNFLFERASTHPVARLDQVSKYDPTGQIGYCYGRAMTVHLMARRMGLSNDSIKKLFIIGDLRSADKPEWRFHVTTLVKGTDGGWFAIDPILYRPMPIHRWTQKVRSIWDKEGAAHLYQVPPSTIIPDLRVVPEVESETGDHIIEISFDPTNLEGFEPRKVPGDQKDTLFDLTDQAAQETFTGAYEEEDEDLFMFLNVTFNDTTLSYHGYFRDLLVDLYEADEESFIVPEVSPETFSTPRSAADQKDDPQNLYSPRFHEPKGEAEDE